MSTRSHTHEVEVAATPDRSFEALITPSAICQWWQAKTAIVLARSGGFWAGSWGEDVDDPDYICRYTIGRFEPSQLIEFRNAEYYSRFGPLPFEADFVTRFTIRPSASGSIVQVQQDGFPTDPVADDFYAGCEKGWRDTFEGLQKYLAK